MCQYSAEDGSATEWHALHLGSLSVSGVGLLMVEMTQVEAIGRISPTDLGLYSQANEAALARVIATCRRYGNAKLGVQIGHAGRKASTNPPWKGGKFLRPEDGAWPTIAPSALPFDDGYPTPQAMARDDIERVITAFADATRRAARIGFDLVEAHSAHGYLLHQFLSPLANRRADEYGGSLQNRMRFPLRVIEAMRAAWPAEKPLGARVSSTDWLDGGFTLDEAVVYARALKERGCDYVCASGGGIVAKAPIQVGPGYMVAFAERVRRDAGIPTRAVGMIVTPQQAESIIAEGKADMVALARAILDDPHWTWHAAEALGAPAAYPPQYERARTTIWPGAKLIRRDT
jgi:2,4-dienoyl-CoA reductase-like NADH-dependent reductase (Old Yellow Enzyme family)